MKKDESKARQAQAPMKAQKSQIFQIPKPPNSFKSQAIPSKLNLNKPSEPAATKKN